jgi:hypothetical protein
MCPEAEAPRNIPVFGQNGIYESEETKLAVGREMKPDLRVLRNKQLFLLHL